jgi:hypothetical protein
MVINSDVQVLLEHHQLACLENALGVEYTSKNQNTLLEIFAWCNPLQRSASK